MDTQRHSSIYSKEFLKRHQVVSQPFEKRGFEMLSSTALFAHLSTGDSMTADYPKDKQAQ